VFELLITVLISYYLAYGIVYMDGPLDIMYKLRAVLPNPFRKLVSCFFCTSLWTSLFACIIAYNGSMSVIAMSLAVAGAVNIIDRLTE
jgi:hypothetical protein